MLIKNYFRDNCTAIVFCKQPSCATRRTYHAQLFSSIAKYVDFDAFFQFYTSDNRVLVLQCGNSSTYDPLANIAYYKSNSFRKGKYVREFQIGPPELWQHIENQVSGKGSNAEQATVFNTMF